MKIWENLKIIKSIQRMSNSMVLEMKPNNME